ncbi:MAG: ABC transporter ATP-binding protein, partial [Peptostreptococcus sp.]|nr:ABC transporter ATP-binding protein [Peptostreptococcus sp.]
SIARAFLKDAPILLLDEATAFADPENENKILKSLEKLKANRTTIMIAHRLNSIKNVDEIIVMKKGQILDKGKHDYLIDNCAYYKDLYKNYSKSIEWRV